MSRIALACFALALTALPASAAPFMEQHGHWTVMAAGPAACMAVNRPPEEFNFAPFNSLALRQRREGPARLQVFAWPGVFKAGETITVTVTIDGTRTELPARAFDSYIAEAAMPADLRGRLRTARVAQFELSGLPQVLLFNVSQIENVMKSVEDCVRQLPRS